MFLVSDLPKLICLNETNIFWPLARLCVTHSIGEAPHGRDVGLLNCALGVKMAFSEIFSFFKVLLCRNFV